MTYWIETPFEHLTALADPTGQGLITSTLIDSDRSYSAVCMRPPQPVTIRGHQFYSITQAARHLGVAPMTVSKAIQKDTLDDVFPKHQWKVFGKHFDTIPEAAAHFDKPVSYIRRHAERSYFIDPIEELKNSLDESSNSI